MTSTVTYSPCNPSPVATARYPAPLPAPETCPMCQGAVAIERDSRNLQERFGMWEWVYACQRCRAKVPTYPNTAIPKGTLAPRKTEQVRQEARLGVKSLYMTGLLSYPDTAREVKNASKHKFDIDAIDELDAPQAAELLAIARALYIRLVVGHIKDLLNGNPAVVPQLILAEWPDEDLDLARNGGKLATDCFEVASSIELFRQTLPESLVPAVSEMKALTSRLYEMAQTPDREARIKSLRAYEDAWRSLGETMFCHRLEEIRYRFNQALPGVWFFL